MRETESEAVTIVGATGPGSTIYVHRGWCAPAPQQTSPDRDPYWRWR
ncbi:hypothetical protein ABZ354_07650 [Streptomyces sp. NPDC005925]